MYYVRTMQCMCKVKEKKETYATYYTTNKYMICLWMLVLEVAKTLKLGFFSDFLFLVFYQVCYYKI